MNKSFIKNFNYLGVTVITIFFWWLIFGYKLSFEPFIWDDLSFLEFIPMKNY